MTWIYVIAGICAFLVLAHLTLVWAENRGWVFYRHRPRVQSIGLLEELVQPSVEHLIEEQSSEAIRADHAESGEQA